MKGLTLEQIQDQVAKLLDEEKQTYEEMVKKYETAKSNEAKAREQASSAYESGDIKAYHKAQDETRFQSDSAELYKNRINEIEKKALITDEEYSQYIEGIEACMNGVAKSETERFKKLLLEMCDIYRTLSAECEEGNRIIYDVQTKLLKIPEDMLGNSDAYKVIDGVPHRCMLKKAMLYNPVLYGVIDELLQFKPIIDYLGADNPAIDSQTAWGWGK